MHLISVGSASQYWSLSLVQWFSRREHFNDCLHAFFPRLGLFGGLQTQRDPISVRFIYCPQGRPPFFVFGKLLSEIVRPPHLARRIIRFIPPAVRFGLFFFFQSRRHHF